MNKFFIFCLLGLLTLIIPVSSQSNVDPDDMLPVDPQIRKGTLKNGLTYYVRENKQPANRVEMRLVLNAGSLQETEQQRGLAHFVEHMCFNGTKNFEKNELVNFLEKMGIDFGADLNAYTSFNETVYFLKLPVENALIDTGLMVLKDWAHNVSFDAEEIDKERGVIVEEWRLGLGAQRRMMQEYIPVLLKGSKYAERLPIGKMEVVKNCPYDTLRRFYYDWYRPDLMAVIVVGDIDAKDMEKKIKKTFRKVSNPDNPKERKEYDIPDNNEPLISIVTDEEATYNIVQFFIKHDKKTADEVKDYKQFLLQRLYNGMLNKRFQEIMQSPEAPFIQANTRYGSFLGRSKDAYSSFAVAKNNKITESLESILEENHKVREHGFTASELEREKKNLMNFYEQALKEKDKNESGNYASEYTRNFLQKEPIPGIENEVKYARTFLPEIGLDEINQLAENWIIDRNWAILITAPEKEGVKVPDKEEVMNVIDESWERETKAYVDDDVSGSPLLEKEPADGKMIDKKYNERLDYTHLTFDNGAQVIMKPNDYKNDRILFLAHSVGGHSLFPLDTFMSAYVASDVINRSGAGNFNEVQLEKKLTGKNVQLDVRLTTMYEGLRGYSSTGDFEDLLKLNYLYFTNHKIDSNAYKTYIDELENRTRYIWSDPRYVFYDTIVKVTTLNHPREITIPTKKQINRISYGQIREVFRDRFSDAGDFYFFIVGNFDSDTIIPYLEKYIGGLPSKGRKELWKDVDPEFPENSKYVYVYKGKEPQSMVSILMNGKFDWNNDRMKFSLLNRILRIQLRDIMREDKGGVYYTNVNGSFSKYPSPEYNMYVSFGCAPENADSLAYTVISQMRKIRKNGVSETDLEKAKKSVLNNRETNKVKNSYWIDNLQDLYFYKKPILSDEEFEQMVNHISSDDIREMAEKYYNVNHYVLGILYPEDVSFHR